MEPQRVARQSRAGDSGDPAQGRGDHGSRSGPRPARAHQEAARLATEAYFAAADPNTFPEQISQEHLRPWAPGRIFNQGGGSGPLGPGCAKNVTPSAAGTVTSGVWGGRPSPRNGGKSWAQVEWDGQKLYVSQGWGGFPDVPTDPNQIGCDYFPQIDSRVPCTLGNSEPAAMLEGAITPVAGGLPLGTGFSLTSDSCGVTLRRECLDHPTAQGAPPGT